MIQRIQTIYLLLAAIAVGIAAFMPLAFISTANGDLFDLYASGLYDVKQGALIQSAIYMLILALVTIVVPIVSIFLFKNRMLQMRVCVIEVVLLIGFYAMVGAYYFLCNRALGQIGIEMQGVHPAIFTPLVAIVLVLCATRAIFNDEIKVKASESRIR